MSEIIARTFVILFVVVYGGLLVAMIGWSIRRWLTAGFKTGPLHNLIHHTRHLHFLHRPRNVH